VTTLDQPQQMQHPAMAAVQEKRAADAQLRVADAITAFAGSMMFVYIHAAIFAVWCGTGLFGADKFPFNFLTMSVSLEAIFLATFVMIGQNRQADFAQKKADHDFLEQETELKVNTALTRAIHELATDIHAKIAAQITAETQAILDKATDSGTPAT
jgi:uncharacterized membrane protein